MHGWLAAVLVCAVAVAGCFQDDGPPRDTDDDGLPDREEERLGTDPQDTDSDDDGVLDGDEVDFGDDPVEPGARVVVADIDTGINVYHEAFAGSLSSALVASFVTDDGKAPVPVKLSRAGDFQERLEADEETWAGLKNGVLYHFEGTRVLGISFNGDSTPVLDYPDGSHGTATAGAVIDANPDAIIVMVENGGGGEGEAWVARQDWIDVVTMSYGPPGSPPAVGAVLGATTHTNTKAMWESGKVPVGAADNSPAVAVHDETAGPPWVIGVGGDDPEGYCREHISGTFPDVTADFTQDLPTADSTEGRESTSGTSFSTPATAGTLSAVILEVRASWGHAGGIVDGQLAVSPDGGRLTHASLRDAMNLTAVYFDFGECTGPDPQPVNPAAPWLQMGWGHVGPEIVNATVSHLLGIQAAPDKPEARQFQEGLMEYRRTYWAIIP